MHAMIIGAAGMIGRKLARRLALMGHLNGDHLDRITLVDVVPSPMPGGAVTVTVECADPAEPVVAARVLASSPDVMFHVAATVMGQAETSVADGYRINFDVLRTLLEAARCLRNKRAPRFVYASSIGVYSPPLRGLIADDQVLRPDSSYGTQKAMSELLLADYSRLFSNILREPLLGREAVLPVSPAVRHWFASPRTAVAFLLHAAGIDTEHLGQGRTLTMPGVGFDISDPSRVKRLLGFGRLVGITTYGRDWWTAAYMGNPPKRWVTRYVRHMSRRSVQTDYLALYHMNVASNAERGAFLAKVENRMAGL